MLLGSRCPDGFGFCDFAIGAFGSNTPVKEGARHRQIFEGDETIDYAFMGKNPDAADNRWWLREAFENRIPIIYFLGIAPGRYQAMLPAFISGWDAATLKAYVDFGIPDRPTAS
jgi:hypothetical protein